MKSSELRIGNWVTDMGSQPFQIDAVDIVALSQSEKAGKINLQYNPIPLTENILEKCLNKVSDTEFQIEIPVEWSKTHHTGYFFIVKWYSFLATGESHTGWRPYLKKPKAFPQLKDEPPVEELFLWGYLKSLHQLQNYYYSITESELTYNPTQP